MSIWLKNKIEVAATFAKRPFVQDSLLLQAGTFFSTAMGIAGSILLARFLGVTGYGDYALLGALLGILTIFSDPGADTAALTWLSEAHAKKDAEKAKEVVASETRIDFLFAGCMGILIALLAPFISNTLYHRIDLGVMAGIWMISSALLSVFAIATTALQSAREIKSLVKIEAFSDFLKALLKIAAAAIGTGLIGVVWGQFAASCVILLVSVHAYQKLSTRDPIFASLKELLARAKSASIKAMLKFGILISADRNVSGLFTTVPLLFLGRYSTPEVAGFFNIAFKYVTLPMILLGGVSRLLGVKFPQSKAMGIANLREKFIKSSLAAGLIAACMLIPTVILAPYLITFFYGTSFISSAKIVIPLAIALLPNAFGIGFGSIYRTLGKVHIGMPVNIALIASGIVLFRIILTTQTPLHSVILLIGFWNFSTVVIHFIISLKLLSDEKKKEDSRILPANTK
jgi:O-antigen/teichoic acid export membrane protein